MITRNDSRSLDRAVCRRRAVLPDALAAPAAVAVLYDDLGSALFDAICALPWYGITRAETRLLGAHGRAIFAALPGFRTIIELGPGNGAKLATLVDGGRRHGERLDLRLIDISPSALDLAARSRWPPCPACRSSLTRRTYESGLVQAAGDTTSGRALVLFLGRISATSIVPAPKNFCAESGGACGAAMRC